MPSLVHCALQSTFANSPQLPGIDHCDIDGFLHKFHQQAPLLIRAMLWVSALVFWATPLLTIGVPVPASWLSSDRRDLHAHRLAVHRSYLLRQSMLMIKTFGGLCWGADPAVRRVLHLDAYPADPGTWRT